MTQNMNSKFTHGTTMIKKFITLLILTISINAQAFIPEDMTDAEYQAIVTQVMAEQGYFDAVAVEDAIGDWLLNQGVPNVDGDLVDSGSCNPCSADGQITSSASSSDKASGPVFHQPRNIKVKAKKNPDGTFKSVVKVKWKRPKNLDASLDYVLDHYLVYISKNNQSYEIFKKKAKFKRNGKPKKKQSLKFKNRGTADYSVQVQAVYVPTDERSSSTDKSLNTLSSSNKSSSQGSTWPPATNFTVIKEPTQVMHLTGAIKTCLNDNGHADSKNLLHIQKDLYCIGYNLQDSDISQMSLLQRVMAIDISNNPSVTNIGPLSELNYLFFLNISQNPNIINSDYSIFEEVRYLRMQNMGLNDLPDLSNNDNLKYLDLTDNNITNGFEQLPAGVDTLVLDNNELEGCTGLAGKEVETVSLAGDKIINADDCNNIIGLKNLEITNAPNLTGNYDINGRTGYCSLNIDNTGITSITGLRPVNILRLTNNQQLKTNDIITRGSSGVPNPPPIHLPIDVQLSGSNNMLCNNVYGNKTFWDTNTPLDMTQSYDIDFGNGVIKQSPVCPVYRFPVAYRSPAVCSPNKVLTNKVSIYKDPYRQKFRFNWNDNQSQVSEYHIQAFDAAGIADANIRSFNTTTALPVHIDYEFDGFVPVTFKIRACNVQQDQGLISCGEWSDDLNFGQSPARVINVRSQWMYDPATDQDEYEGNTHHVTFNYTPDHVDHNFRQNGYFKIRKEGQATIVDTKAYDQHVAGEEYYYRSRDFLQDENLELTTLMVSACIPDSVDNTTEICGAMYGVSVSTAPILATTDNQTQSALIPDAHFVEGTSLICNENNNLMSFKLKAESNDDNNQDASLVDYFSITEYQPVSKALGSDTGRTQITYMREVNRISDSRVESETTLKRQVNGHYRFEVKACHKNEGAPDTCSALRALAAGCSISKPLSINPVPQGSLKWYSKGVRPDGKKKRVIKWNYDDDNKPDYFYVRKKGSEDDQENIANPGNSAQNACNNTRDIDPAAGQTDYKTYSKFEFGHFFANEEHNLPEIDQLFDDPEYWSTRMLCSGGIVLEDESEVSEWEVYACESGIGCTQPAVIDISDSASGGGPIDPPTITATPGFNSTGGPGVINPGVWSNPYQSGTGWYFYWVNKVKGIADQDTLSRPYDLKAYWITYKEIDGVWSPVWLTANLINLPIGNNNKIYKGSIEYSYMTSNGLRTVNSGSMELLFYGEGSQLNDNQHVRILLDVDYTGSLFSQNQVNYDSVGLNVPNEYRITDDGKIVIPLRDFAISGVNGNPIYGTSDNDLDHYSGAWSNANHLDASGGKPMTVLTWIQKEFELMDILFYDDVEGDGDIGEPMWVQTQSCGVNCVVTEDWFPQLNINNDKNFYTVTQGFNPLGYAEVDYRVSNHVQYVATAQRNYAYANPSQTGSRFKQLQLDYDITIPFNRNSDFIDLGGRNVNISVNDALFDKVGNVHSIEFFLTNSDGTEVLNINTCDPNDPETNGECVVHFNWFTTDYYQNIRAYYKKQLEDGTFTEPALLSELCGHSFFGSDPYTEYNYQCFIYDPGVYQFELRKPSYTDTLQTVLIAESEFLTILECGESCSGEVVGPAAEPVPPMDFTGSISADAASDLVGTTAGAFDIDESGSANYSIPIFAPAGRGGMTPQMALSYNSSAGNGIAGMGWNITGTSAITRCLKSPEHDPDLDHYQAISMTDADALCLDGQRMFKLADGTYRTEIDSFSRITAVNTTGQGPEKFKVETKSGEIRIYGAPGNAFKADKIFSSDVNTGAQVIANTDNETVHTWLLNKIEDRHGNKIHFLWDTFDGESYLSYIRWTNPNGAATNHHYEIEFQYSNSRADAMHHYAIGTQYKSFRNLQWVRTMIRPRSGAAMQEVRRLQLNYEATPNPTGVLRLASIRQCENHDVNTCLQPVEFSWDDTQLDYAGGTTDVDNISKFREMGFGSYKSIDIDGDGQMELIFVRGYDDGNIIYIDIEARYWIAYHREPGEGQPYGSCEHIAGAYFNYLCDTGIEPFDGNSGYADTFNPEKWFVLDYNGDGYQDILTPDDKLRDENGDMNWYVFLSNGTKICRYLIDGLGNLSNSCEDPTDPNLDVSMYDPVNTGIVFHNRNAGSALLDYTADGLPDLLTLDVDTSRNIINLYNYKVYPMIKKDTDSTSPHAYRFANNNDDQVQNFIDFEAEKLIPQDMMCQYDDEQPTPCILRETSGDIPPRIIAGKLESTATDFNGDGYNDAVFQYTYRYVPEACNIQGPPPNNPNLVNLAMDDYTADAMPVDDGTEGGGSNHTQHCQQKFRVAMLYDRDDQGNISFKYAGRLGIIEDTVVSNSFPLKVVSCNEGNTTAECLGTINKGLSSGRIMDVNGDGLADRVYLTKNNAYKYQLNTGLTESVTVDPFVVLDTSFDGYTYEKLLFDSEQTIIAPVTSGLPYCTTDEFDDNDADACARRMLTQFIDYDMDGDIDILYPKTFDDTESTITYELKKYQKLGNGSFGYGGAVDTGIASYATNKQPQAYINAFFDLNGDGHSDYFTLLRDVDPLDNTEDKNQTVRMGSGVGQVRNKIIKITNQLSGQHTHTIINYTVATDSTVYEKSDVNSFATMLDIGNGSPVFDLLAPNYLVSSTEKTAPGYADVEMSYFYKGQKIQGGGRGSLGFESIESFDDQHNMRTTTFYHQDFPFTGNAESTLMWYEGSVTGKVSESISFYEENETVVSGKTIYFPYLRKSIEHEYSLNAHISDQGQTVHALDASAQKSVINEFIYNADDIEYGNLTEATITTCAGLATTTNCNTMVETKTTVNAYDYAPATISKWLLGRLTSSTVTTDRAASSGPKVRSSSFKYHTDTGQLIRETIAGDDSQYLTTVYQHDIYGQTTATYQCSSHYATDGQCENTAQMKARPMKNDVKRIQRYKKTAYETQWYEYPQTTTEPFSSYSDDFDLLTSTGAELYASLDEGTVVEEVTSSVISRDIYGNPTEVQDMYENRVATAYGRFGEALATGSSLGAKSQTIKRWCSSQAVNHCPGSANSVVETLIEGAPNSRKYHDVLGREVRSQTQDMVGDWITVDTYYDQLGRTIRQSEPYARNRDNNSAATTPAFTYTVYDDLDRVLSIVQPNHCQESITDSTHSCISQTVVTTTAYDGLTVEVTNPLMQVTKRTYDVTGKIVTSTDSHESQPGTVSYTYDANGNLQTTTGHHGVISMFYDDLGRKTRMIDPDKGTWEYQYNALGEMVEQTHNGHIETTLYDLRGRMFYRESSDEVSLWQYDISNKGLLKHEYSVAGHNPDDTSTKAQLKAYLYDNYSRPSEVLTLIYDGEQAQPYSYESETTYDEYGRVFQSIDATGNGVLYQYNEYGFQTITRDAANGLNGQIYHQVLSTDVRGNVINEKHYDRFTTNKSYDADTGYLQTIKTESASGVIQDLSYAFDKLGHLIRRTDHTVSNSPGADHISETFEYDSLNRLKAEFLDYNSTPEATYVYDASGNLTQKGEVTLTYAGTGNAGPHAVTSSSLDKSYHYDSVGNVIQRRTNNDFVIEATFAYTSFDKPHTISANGWETQIAYDANRNRYIRKDIKFGGAERKITHYLGDVEYIYEVGKPVKSKRYIGHLVITIDDESTSRARWDFNYLLKDHIGSTHTVANRFGNAIANFSFNAWGQRRVAPRLSGDNNYAVIPISQVWNTWGLGLRAQIDETTNRGFTGHEHLDQVGIIHMNGRIYDPTIGRFLQADPIIQDPYDTQSLNRYSYVMNNPLSYTDPTGYSRLRSGWWRAPLSIAAAFIPIPGVSSLLAKAAIRGALSGAIATGNLKGAVRGAIQAAVTSVIGHGLDGKSGIKNDFARGFTHAVVGGVSAEVDGGKFGHGFASSAVSSIADGVLNLEDQHAITRVVANVVIAGTMSEVTGGKFANGAISAAFRVVFNEMAMHIHSSHANAVENEKMSIDEMANAQNECRGEGGACVAWGVVGNGLALPGAGSGAAKLISLLTRGTAFKSGVSLTSHFNKHGSEFAVKTAREYLKLARNVMKNGIEIQYRYQNELRTGYVQFIGLSRKGKSIFSKRVAKFAFVGTNRSGDITTFHVKSGNEFWRLLNNNSQLKNITPKR